MWREWKCISRDRCSCGRREGSTKGLRNKEGDSRNRKTGKKIPPKENRNGIKEFQKASMGDGKGLHATTMINWVVLNYYKACLQGSVPLLCFQRQAPTPTIPIFRLDRLIHHIIFVIACFPVLRVGSLTRSTRYFTSTTGFPLSIFHQFAISHPRLFFVPPIRSLMLFFFLFFESTHDGISPL